MLSRSLGLCLILAVFIIASVTTASTNVAPPAPAAITPIPSQPAVLIQPTAPPASSTPPFVMKPENWISLFSIMITATIAIISMLVGAKRNRDEVQRIEHLMEVKHELIPHVEFNLDCRFLGPQRGEKTEQEYVAEILIGVNNRGNVQHILKSIKLRVRGIKSADNLKFWEGHSARLEFPDRLFETEAIDKSYGFYFIEPGVNQIISYTTKICADYQFIAVWAEFSYGRDRKGKDGYKHKAERVFQVTAASN